MRTQVFLAVATSAVLSPVAGAGTFYTSRSAWLSALSQPVFCEDFESDTIGNYPTPFSSSGGWTVSSLTTPLTIQVLGFGQVNGTQELHFRDFGAGVLFTPPGGAVGAVGFDYGTAIETWNFTVDFQTSVLPPQTAGFIGYIGTPFNDFVLTSPSPAQGGISVDDLCIPVPGPGPAAVLALAGLMLAPRRRLR